MTSLSSNQQDDATPILGGSYRQVRDANEGGQVHHIPADSISPVAKEDGPGIWMTTTDHQRTGSWGRGADQREYREKQKQLIDTNGWDGYKDAMQMDIDDIHKNFGDKYDQGINQALEYVNNPESELKQKFEDAVKAKESESFTQKPESSESTSGDQVNKILPAQKSVEISPKERKRLSDTYSQKPSDTPNQQEQTETSKDSQF
jgi:hypothetical protein